MAAVSVNETVGQFVDSQPGWHSISPQVGFRHKTHLAYTINKYQHPIVSNYFKSQGVEMNGDLYALSEMVQWLWRGCIRDYIEGQEMTVYIPSRRMRNLLKLWLRCDSVAELYDALGVPFDGQPQALAA